MHMGMPISLQMFFEMGAFIIVGMLASKLSTVQNASHSITISIATMLFMIPLGLSSAAALTLSKLNGEKQHRLAVRYGWSTIRLGLIYAVSGSFLILLLQKWILRIYTQDPETIGVSEKILWIAALFQIGDASQVILAGCLRGFGKSRTQAIVNGIGHWLIGLPVGLFCAYVLKWEVFGLWIGLCAGLFAVAFGLFYFWKKAISEPDLVIEKETKEITL
jgi:MATE family multidrug resistance protein